MGKESPAPPDFRGAAREQADASRDIANQQTVANRPNITTPFAQQQWTRGPDGQWSLNAGFTGPLGVTATNLQNQLTQSYSQPLNLDGLPAASTGDSARQQAIDSAYTQATSRLDPMWKQREESQRTRLLNQGLVEGSEAYQQQMGELGRQRNDAYTSALAAAVAQGTAAGDSVFRNNLAGRQSALSEMLRLRGQPMAEMQGLQGLMAMPGFQGASAGQTPNLFGAAQARYGADMGGWQAENQADADFWGNAIRLGMTAYGMSDVRAKQDVTFLSREVLPGVRLATWRYLPEYGDASVRYVGVIAQDLARVAPKYVLTGPDGLLRVHPLFAPEALS